MRILPPEPNIQGRLMELEDLEKLDEKDIRSILKLAVERLQKDIEQAKKNSDIPALSYLLETLTHVRQGREKLKFLSVSVKPN